MATSEAGAGRVGQRATKETRDHTAGSEPPPVVALSVYPGDFERRGLTYGVEGDYEATQATETQYLIGGARIVWEKAPNTVPMGLDRDARITVAVADLIQSTSAVIDLVSGELLETQTFYPNGAMETHRMQKGVSMASEPMGFTGKEADSEVGVVYFGERYLLPRVGRWASPDPAEIHALGGGEVGNAYHYIGGDLLQALDPLGLNPRRKLQALDALLAAASHVVNGRTMTHFRRFAGKNVTVAMVREQTTVGRSEAGRAMLDRIAQKFKDLSVPYSEGAVVDFSAATHSGRRKVVFDKIELGHGFDGNRSGQEIDRAWEIAQQRYGWDAEKLAQMKADYTMHHSHIDGEMHMVDTDVHNAFRHTGGDALARGGFFDAASRLSASVMFPNMLTAAEEGDPHMLHAAARDMLSWTVLGPIEVAEAASDLGTSAIATGLEAAAEVEDDTGVSLGDWLNWFVDEGFEQVMGGGE